MIKNKKMILYPMLILLFIFNTVVITLLVFDIDFPSNDEYEPTDLTLAFIDSIKISEESFEVDEAPDPTPHYFKDNISIMRQGDSIEVRAERFQAQVTLNFDIEYSFFQDNVQLCQTDLIFELRGDNPLRLTTEEPSCYNTGFDDETFESLLKEMTVEDIMFVMEEVRP